MKCAACGVVVPDGRVTFMGQPICMKCVMRGLGVKSVNSENTKDAEP